MTNAGTMFEPPAVRQNTNIYQNATTTIADEGRVKMPPPKPSNVPGVKPGTQFFKPPSLVSDGGGDMQYPLPLPHGGGGGGGRNGSQKVDVPNPTTMNHLKGGDDAPVPLPPYIEQSPSPVNPVSELFGDPTPATHSGSRRAEEAIPAQPVKMAGIPPADNYPPNGLTGNIAPPERRRNSVSNSSRQNPTRRTTPPPSVEGEKLVPKPATVHPDFMQFSATPGSEVPVRKPQKSPAPVPARGARKPQALTPHHHHHHHHLPSHSSLSSVSTSDYSDVSSSMTLMEMKASRSRIIAEVKVIQRDLSEMEMTGNSNPRELSKMRRRLGELQGILKELLLDMEVHQRSPWRRRQWHQNPTGAGAGAASTRSRSKKREKRNHLGVRPIAVSGSTTASQQASDHQRLVDSLVKRQQLEVEAARVKYEEQIRQLQANHRNEQTAQQQQMQREQEKLFEYEQAVARAGALKQQLLLAQADVMKNETALHSTALMSKPSDRYLHDGLPSYHNNNNSTSSPYPYHRAVSPSYHQPLHSSPLKGRPER